MRLLVADVAALNPSPPRHVIHAEPMDGTLNDTPTVEANQRERSSVPAKSIPVEAAQMPELQREYVIGDGEAVRTRRIVAVQGRGLSRKQGGIRRGKSVSVRSRETDRQQIRIGVVLLLIFRFYWTDVRRIGHAH